ncbi:hypothetical protein GCM10025867_29510 [Frondihabitans sucicola]|uniref:Alcohol dehydrogenase-like N-terminal domain-containing protein n=1 Tax=Frondihabitans sucicola TaxID=1268041 RepID=A0ABN6Y091_9MICO|nr:alcohol dehydrogenase catalytic domain-containing protein [Frondihabitans sucicola]BDZ50710.1 hypothetical protein GCM10025867_29510 [Frondihabitans sucicola]
MTDAPELDGLVPTSGRAVRFERYGDRDVLQVVDVAVSPPGPGEVLVQVKAAGTNPGEAAIRQGYLDSVFPATFPSGQGTDFAGVVVASGAAARFSPGDEVIGWVETRSSQAEYVTAPDSQLVPKPKGVSWEVAGSLFVVAATATAAVGAVEPVSAQTVVVSSAAGGVGSSSPNSSSSAVPTSSASPRRPTTPGSATSAPGRSRTVTDSPAGSGSSHRTASTH